MTSIIYTYAAPQQIRKYRNRLQYLRNAKSPARNTDFGENVSEINLLYCDYGIVSTIPQSKPGQEQEAMLAQFSVENFLSFNQKATFSMVAATGDTQHLEHVVTFENTKTRSLLRCAAIYGANAAGKSNLVEAIRFAKDLILRGTRSNQAIPVTPCKLEAARDRPSRFEFIFTMDGVPYSYGFILNSSRILEEWLYATPNKQEVLFFQRTTPESNLVNVEFGASFAGKSKQEHQFLEFVARGTRHNQLFLTEAEDRNVARVAPVTRWFDDVLTIISAEARYVSLETTVFSSAKLKTFMRDLLRAAGTGIDDIAFEVITENYETYFPGLSAEKLEEIEQKLLEADDDMGMVVQSSSGKRCFLKRGAGGRPELLMLKTQHRDAQGNTVEFGLEEESDGTQRLIHLTPGLFNLKERRAKVFLLDELDRRLHPLLSRLLVETALDCEQDTSQSQLIFTTHETSLLDLALLRRDEIWFVEKDRAGSSQLYSLAEFKPRPDLKIEKGYLNGRFGAIPFIGNICDLGWTDARPLAGISGER